LLHSAAPAGKDVPGRPEPQVVVWEPLLHVNLISSPTCAFTAEGLKLKLATVMSMIVAKECNPEKKKIRMGKNFFITWEFFK
jgi:hypothetical protein